MGAEEEDDEQPGLTTTGPAVTLLTQPCVDPLEQQQQQQHLPPGCVRLQPVQLRQAPARTPESPRSPRGEQLLSAGDGAAPKGGDGGTPDKRYNTSRAASTFGALPR